MRLLKFFGPAFLLISLVLPTWAHAGAAKIVTASWYGTSFAGHLMANGEAFNPADPTIAAHRTLPLGTALIVTNLATGRTLIVVVQDRGPFVYGRSLDLSLAAARVLGYSRKGIARLRIEELRQ